MRSLDKGPSPTVCIKVPEALLKRLDRKCRSFGLDRSALLRQIITSALDQAEREDAK